MEKKIEEVDEAVDDVWHRHNLNKRRLWETELLCNLVGFCSAAKTALLLCKYWHCNWAMLWEFCHKKLSNCKDFCNMDVVLSLKPTSLHAHAKFGLLLCFHRWHFSGENYGIFLNHAKNNAHKNANWLHIVALLKPWTWNKKNMGHFARKLPSEH